MPSNSRRSFLQASGMAGIGALAGCIGSITGGDGGPLTIGAPVPLSGPLDLLGQETRSGHKFGLDYVDNTINDREVEVVVEDTETNPSVGLQKVKKLVEEDQVDLLMGVSSSAVGLGIAPYLKNEVDVPFIISQVWTTDARENSKYCNRDWFFSWASARQGGLANAKFIYNHLESHEEGSIDTTKAHFIGLDYAAGQSARDNFSRDFGNLGGSMTGETMVPPDETDYSVYMEDLSNADADVITAFLPGPAGVQFMKQSHEYGLKDSKAVVGMVDTASPVSTSAAGASANGIYNTDFYAAETENELVTV